MFKAISNFLGVGKKATSSEKKCNQLANQAMKTLESRFSKKEIMGKINGSDTFVKMLCNQIPRGAIINP